MSGTALWVEMAVGFVPGLFVGRWWSETTRGRHDAARSWANRKSHRK